MGLNRGIERPTLNDQFLAQIPDLSLLFCTADEDYRDLQCDFPITSLAKTRSKLAETQHTSMRPGLHHPIERSFYAPPQHIL